MAPGGGSCQRLGGENVENLTILAAASGVVAVAKPAGLPTQAVRGIPSVEAWARAELVQPPGAGYLGVPHRLDRAVSGVLLLATTPRAARKLSRQFERRQVRKTYLAVVANPPGPAPGVPESAAEWRDLVAKLPDEPRAAIVAEGSGGREAVTLARLRARIELAGAARLVLELQPLTGRMHQLRLQAAVRGMPVVGDCLYGGPALAGNAAADGDSREAPILLHAWSIAYADPDTGAAVEVIAPLPPHWPAVI
ncbi:MAG: hypothetical protein RLZZ440_2301 [Planctomycetota bacterium]